MENTIELTDEQLSQVVGGCGGHQQQQQQDNNCGDSWESQRRRRHQGQHQGHRGSDGCGEHGFGLGAHHTHC